jgi:hypothetical protein
MIYQQENLNIDKLQNTDLGGQKYPRICVFSQRHLQRLVSRCAEYEFEDLICEIDDAELLTPEPRRWFRFGQKIANRLTRYLSIASLNPGVRRIQISRDYDLFFAICQSPRDLLSINAIKGWRDHCRTSVCWLAELWAGELHKWEGHLKILSKFDYIISTQFSFVKLCSNGSIHSVRDVNQSSCTYMPPAIDTIKFCPYPNLPERCVYVYSLGRKSPVTHQALLKMAEQRQIFYIYDTSENMNTLLPQDHRILVANIAKRSRYFITNAPKIDRHFETCGQDEISYRFFEGAASGTVMIGENKESEAFRKHFNWPDAVIHVPYDAPNILEVLTELDSQPERLEKIRKNNIVQSLLRHDWVYRWRAILDIVGLEPRPALIAREERLRKLAEDIRKTS